jgi:integrin beta 1
VRIEESSIGLESLEMDINIDHGCPCLAEEVGENNSTLCGYHGEMKCGMCLCDEGWTGKVCECNLQSYASSKALENQCREPYEEDGETKFTPICSNNGECLCGRCYCNVGMFGKYCNCKECPM